MNITPLPPEQAIPKIRQESARFKLLTTEIAKVVVGHQESINFVLMAILCNGHILLEGIPGIAKTTLINTVAKALGLDFKRIQFTPDLLPSDVIGTLIYNSKTQEFETKKGPIFANLVLADEINRAPAKVQAALLEAMQERQITLGTSTYCLEQPFLVFATQNPLEQEGTYRLPEAQVDRFMFKLLISYPSMEQEREIITKTLAHHTIMQVLTREDISQAQDALNNVYIDSKIVDYIVSLIFATREPERFNLKTLRELIAYGASPRATLALYYASQAHAFLQGRHFVTPDDVKAVCCAVLRHRIILSYQAESEQITVDTIIKQIITTVPSP